MLFGYGGESEIYSVLYSAVWRVPVWSGVWGRDESVFGDLSISLSHVLVDFKRLYSTGTRDRGQARVCAVENRSYSSKGRSYPTGRVCPLPFDDGGDTYRK